MLTHHLGKFDGGDTESEHADRSQEDIKEQPNERLCGEASLRMV